MAICDHVFEWYEDHVDRYRQKGARFELRPPFEHSEPVNPVRVCPEAFEYRGNELDIYLWEAGHLERTLYRAAIGEVEIEYHHVESGSEAAVIIEKWLEEFISLRPGPPPEEARRLIASGKLPPWGEDVFSD